MGSIRKHLTYANVVSTLCLFVLLGGVAVAVDGPNPGQNTVGSEDIIGNEVKSDDIGNGRIFNLDIADEIITGQKLKNGTVGPADLARDQRHVLGAPGEISLNVTADCRWENYANGFQVAAFHRDHEGTVHLSGLVQADDVGTSGCSFGFGPDEIIFTLPGGYRPEGAAVNPVLTNAQLGRIDVRPSGVVRVEAPSTTANLKQWVSLEGISFPCAPSGQDGCP